MLAPPSRRDFLCLVIAVPLALPLSVHSQESPDGSRAPPRAESWQRQTLLAATDTEYLVLEGEGHNPGRPDVWSETVRIVRFDAKTNARGAAELVRVEVWRAMPDGTRQIDTTRSSPVSLGKVLDEFGGQLVPTPAVRLRREFRIDAKGVFLLDANGGRVEILTREEIESRAARKPHPPGFPHLDVVALQSLGKQYFLTLRGGEQEARRELVMRIPR